MPAFPDAKPAPRAYAVAHLTVLSLPPLELIDAAADAGYDLVGLRGLRVTAEEPLYPLATDKALRDEVKRRCAATGVRVWDLEVVRLDGTAAPESFRPLLEAAADLGARHVIVHVYDRDAVRAAAAFARLCELAAPLGVCLQIEFIPWSQVPGLEAAADLLRAVRQPNAGILVDTLHFARSRSLPALLRELPAPWFQYAHVCDAPAVSPQTVAGLIHTARHERLFPGEGGIDLRAILDALPAGIPWAVEVPNDALVARWGEREHLRRALQATRRHLAPVAA